MACLGGECFGEAGQGFLRFSCAEPDERIDEAMAFLPRAIAPTERIRRYLRPIRSICSPNLIRLDSTTASHFAARIARISIFPGRGVG